MSRDCAQAETLAGAIALGEATDGERDAYRRHISGCARCVSANGGERQIERIMRVIADARDGESWEPDIRNAIADRGRSRRRVAWRWGISGAVVAIAASIGIHTFVAAGIQPMAAVNPHPAGAVAYNVMHIAIEKRPREAARPAAAAGMPQPHEHRLVVVHNVVTLDGAQAKRVAVTRSASQSAPSDRLVKPAGVASIAPSKAQVRSIVAMRTAPNMQLPQVRAESIAMVPPPPSVRDVIPLGGETAIVPHPPAIAYEEGAQGTTAFEVSVDERGVPQKCTIVKSSNYLVLDEAVCKAAMSARYVPRTVNGRAVASTYKDAFTFRASEDQ